MGTRPTLKEGTNVLMTSSMSDEDTESKSSWLNTSIGTAVSSAVRPARRVPIVTISSTASSAPCAETLVGNEPSASSTEVIASQAGLIKFFIVKVPPND